MLFLIFCKILLGRFVAALIQLQPALPKETRAGGSLNRFRLRALRRSSVSAQEGKKIAPIGANNNASNSVRESALVFEDAARFETGGVRYHISADR
jgi:hypothetical protein